MLLPDVRCTTMQSATTSLQSADLSSVGDSPHEATALQLPLHAEAGGPSTMAQTTRNAAVSETASAVTKAALGPVLGSVARTTSVAGRLSVPVSIVGLALGAGGLSPDAYGVFSAHRLRGTELQGERDMRGEELAGLQIGVQLGCKQLADCINDMSVRLRSDVASAKDEIVEAMREGFQGLHTRVEAMEEKMEALVQQYNLCFSVLANGKSNSDEDCKDLEGDAKEAIAKITCALKAFPKGHVGRMPLVAMHIFATRARVDARDMRTIRESSPEDPFREELLRQAMALIKEEVVAVLASHTLTLYTAGVILARPLAQYRLLHQGLALALQGSTSQQHLVVRVDGQLVPSMGSESVVWDDGLDTIRELFTEEREGHSAIEAFKVATLSDLHWYEEWKELGRETLVSQIPSQVSVQQVLTELGVPVHRRWGLDMDGIKKLKALVLPGFRRQVEVLLTKALEPLGANVCVAVGESASRELLGAKGVPVAVDESASVESVGAKVAVGESAPLESLGAELPVAIRESASLESLGAKVCVAADENASLESHPRPSASKQWEGGECIATLKGHTQSVLAFAFASDGTLFSGSVDKTIKQWKGGKCIATLEGHTALIFSLAIASDGTLFSSSDDKTIKQWKGGECIATLEGHTAGVPALSFAPDGSLFSSSKDKTIKQWKVGKCIATFEGHTDMVFALAFASDGTLFSGSMDNTIKQWRGGKCIATLKGHTNSVIALAFASDGTLFSGSYDNTIRQWKGGKCIATLEGHTSFFGRFSLAPDGTLFSGNDDKAIKQWKGGRCIATLEGHMAQIWALAFAPDGTLFSGSVDKTIKQWKFRD